MLQYLPVLVLMILLFVMMFGIGFIVNMLMKTTWLPCLFFVIVILPVVVYSMWNHDEATFWAHISSYRVVDYLTGVAGLAGTFLSGWAIHTLRVKGFKMF
ncbi:YuiB family protein [Paenibacillus faecalis]|uniref:YuiB family protein n=1 Tax=Paenibacillus faecalis TaxID=2079532 RepID=UPI000D10840F|nr:YuiB family protein [Paenibacillus faecalis]